MDDSTISLTGSDVFQQTTPHIAKPPRHFYQDVDDNDDVDDDELFRRPTSPPRDHYSFGIIIKAAKQDETDGGGDDDDQTCRSQSGGGASTQEPPACQRFGSDGWRCGMVELVRVDRAFAAMLHQYLLAKGLLRALVPRS